MSLLSADAFFVEHPYNFLSLLSRPHYRVQVFTEQDVPLASVSERTGPGLQRPLRHTGFNGWTSFDLVVTAPHGQPLMHIRKPFGRKPRIRVTTPNGQVIGSLQRQTNRLQVLHDTDGRQLCMLGDVVHIQTGHRAKRNGKRVRRDVVRIRPGVAEPVRSLAIAGTLMFDIVRGAGTSRISGDFDWSALGG
ncbi:hypothetical protein FXN61_09985 [Lentzea sp. PSKA42]|uniref:Uncharacterized protein n=1 Tax=Lentzea indica TaxID=2604800 RepID=A0ABX1FEK1_9PSEU|nr:hypothetical protein [Lentzea indica]NKE57146.1 hypothetical protein [Lentzea indica]